MQQAPYNVSSRKATSQVSLVACRPTCSVLLVEPASDVQAPVVALATQVKAYFVGAVLTLVALALDGVQATRVAAHPACDASYHNGPMLGLTIQVSKPQ